MHAGADLVSVPANLSRGYLSEGVSYLNVFPVGEPSWSRCKRCLPGRRALPRKCHSTVARGTGPRDRHRQDVCFPSVVCDRLITNGSGSGDPDLQGLPRERCRNRDRYNSTEFGITYLSRGHLWHLVLFYCLYYRGFPHEPFLSVPAVARAGFAYIPRFSACLPVRRSATFRRVLDSR